MLGMVDIEYIRKKHFIEGWKIRRISRNLGISRQTVRKALKSSEIPRYTLTQAKPCIPYFPALELIISLTVSFVTLDVETRRAL